MRDRKDAALDEAVIRLNHAALEYVRKDRRAPLYLKYFPDGLQSLTTSSLPTEVRRVGTLIAKLADETAEELKSQAASLASALAELHAAIAAQQKALDAEAQSYGILQSEKIAWLDAYRQNHRRLELHFHDRPLRAEAYFRPTPRTREDETAEPPELQPGLRLRGSPLRDKSQRNNPSPCSRTPGPSRPASPRRRPRIHPAPGRRRKREEDAMDSTVKQRWRQKKTLRGVALAVVRSVLAELPPPVSFRGVLKALETSGLAIAGYGAVEVARSYAAATKQKVDLLNGSQTTITTMQQAARASARPPRARPDSSPGTSHVRLPEAPVIGSPARRGRGALGQSQLRPASHLDAETGVQL